MTYSFKTSNIALFLLAGFFYLELKPSMLQTTCASLLSHESSQTVPQMPLYMTCTLPWLRVRPPTSLTITGGGLGLASVTQHTQILHLSIEFPICFKMILDISTKHGKITKKRHSVHIWFWVLYRVERLNILKHMTEASSVWSQSFTPQGLRLQAPRFVSFPRQLISSIQMLPEPAP